MKCSKYLFNIAPTVSTCNTRITNNIPLFKVKLTFFHKSLFASVVIKLNKLHQNIRNSESLNIFKITFLKFIYPSESTGLNCHNPKGVKC